MKTIVIKKGRDLHLKGKAEARTDTVPPTTRVGVIPQEFPGIKPKLSVQEGDKVKIGSPLFHDRSVPDIRVLSPGAGTVSSIVRGAKRAVEKIIIDLDSHEEQAVFGRYRREDFSKLSHQDIVNHLMEGGLWPYVRQRPFCVIANPGNSPRSVFINGMNTEPLSADASIVMEGQKEFFHAGVEILSQLATGSTYLCIAPGSSDKIDAFRNVPKAQIFEFQGPHPAGNTSVHIHSIEPLNKGEIIWYLTAFETALIGRFFLQGQYPIERKIALSGWCVKAPQHYVTRLGAPISELAKGNIEEDGNRFISGSVFSGFTHDWNGFISYYHPDVTVIPEREEREFLGWMDPGLKRITMSQAFLSSLNPGQAFVTDTHMHGSERAIVLTDIYDKYLPMDILALPLVKAVLAGDTTLAENLGLLECAPEDFALASFMDPSKLDICGIIQKGLDLLRKETL